MLRVNGLHSQAFPEKALPFDNRSFQTSPQEAGCSFCSSYLRRASFDWTMQQLPALTMQADLDLVDGWSQHANLSFAASRGAKGASQLPRLSMPPAADNRSQDSFFEELLLLPPPVRRCR